jgi:glycosyltransferase involved in cell wall biosynthesis
MQQPLVSIAMPFRNSERTLAEAIRSIQLQTFEDWELLLCDDGSGDGSANIARAAADARMMVRADGLLKDRGTRLNECIDSARGVYFARMDADDICYPGRIAAQVRFMKENPGVDLVGTSMAIFGEGGACLGKRSGPPGHARICRTPSLGFRLFHPTWLGKLSWFRRYRYKSGMEDQDLLFRAYSDSTYANIADILHGYREEVLDLHKIAAYRRDWYRQLGDYVSGVRGVASRATLGGSIICKTLLDHLAVSTGLGHKLLRQRAIPASAEEQARWRAVWLAVQSPAALERRPEVLHG